MNQTLWDECITFHGHSCPGLAIGYRASELAAEFFGRMPSAKSDEMVVCVTENDACGVDAVQHMTGCTLGKGNLVFRPTGKMAFSFFDRDTDKSIRVLLNPAPREMDRDAMTEWILTGPAEEVFTSSTPSFAVPERARHFANETCETCGERAPEHKTRLQEGKKVCLDCFTDYSNRW